jgi:CelD/BcsL family acetyltransferase involved in cellulose biosynthesis
VRTTVAISRDTTPGSWHELVMANGGCFFHRYEWLTTMADVLGLDFHALTVEADGKPVGVAPMLVKRVGPVRTVNWLPFPYIGPLVPAELLPDVLPLLAAWERRRLTVRSQHVLMSTVESFAHYAGVLDRTFVIEFAGQDEESLLRNVAAKRRAKLRRAVTGGVQIRPATEVEVCELLPAWTAATFAAQGLPAPYPANAYATVWSVFGDSPDVRFSTAVLDDEPVCVQGSFAGAPVGVAWAMATAGSAVASFAQPLLYWDTIMWALARRCVAFDLVGAPTEGVAAYKRDWGARETHYTVLRRQAVAHRIAMRLRAAVTPGPR